MRTARPEETEEAGSYGLGGAIKGVKQARR